VQRRAIVPVYKWPSDPELSFQEALKRASEHIEIARIGDWMARLTTWQFEVLSDADLHREV
jgi:hypothetical protein